MVRIKVKKEKTETKGEDLPNSLGGKLRKAREDKGISIEEARKATKIHPNVIEAIEGDKLEQVLGKTYVKAFIKTYAAYLGFDKDEIIQEYTSKQIPKTEENLILQQEPILQKGRKINRVMAFAFVVIIAWLFILGFATTRFIHRAKEVFISKKAEPEEITPQMADRITSRGIIPIPKRRTITLTLITTDDAWLKVTQDGTVAFHGILPKNSKETWEADKWIKLTEIGRPHALSFKINGTHFDLSGQRLGKRILISHEGINLAPRPED
jgi:transcriptional regulator with XRE-family HTH domain